LSAKKDEAFLRFFVKRIGILALDFPNNSRTSEGIPNFLATSSNGRAFVFLAISYQGGLRLA
jgi:hypothetical protein